MIALVVYPLLTAAAYYLGSWALVTRWLWEQYPPVVGAFMACAACSGFWYGLLAGFLLPSLGLPFPGGPLVAALCSMVWTPVVAKRMIYDLDSLKPGDDDGQDPGA